MKRQDEYAQMIRDKLAERRALAEDEPSESTWKDWMQRPPAAGVVIATLFAAMVVLLFLIR